MQKHEELLNLFSKFNERPIAFMPIYAKISGSISSGLLLSQLCYWAKVMRYKEFYKIDRELMEETTLTERQIRTSKNNLKKLGLISTKLKGIPAKLYYTVNIDKIIEILSENEKEDNNINKIQETKEEVKEELRELTENVIQNEEDLANIKEEDMTDMTIKFRQKIGTVSVKRSEQCPSKGRNYIHDTTTYNTHEIKPILFSEKKSKEKPKKETIKKKSIETLVDQKPFCFDEKVDFMKNLSKDKRMPIIATYWELKGFRFDCKETYQSAIRRDIKAADMLRGYDLNRITEVIIWLNKNINFKTTLETVHKYIDENLEELSRKIMKGKQKSVDPYNDYYGDQSDKYKELEENTPTFYVDFSKEEQGVS